MAEIVSVFMDIKSKYGLSLVVVHHFSNKENPDAPVSTTGRFMGHSVLSNAADILIGIDSLHPRYKSQKLPLPYSHYVSVDTTTRHAEWPAKFYAERGENKLLFQRSGIWQEIGRKILPEEIVDFIKANGGACLQELVIEKFRDRAHENTVRKAIAEAEQLLGKERLSGKHGRVLLKLKDTRGD